MIAYGQDRTYANSFTTRYQNSGKVHLDVSRSVRKNLQRKLNKVNVVKIDLKEVLT